ncbi:MAG: ABC transporter ATP-binding protein [Paludibacteraceae bacterium]|nr:ABC transporter ATP-binding protein [Paludibacteraceae bacterium]
MLNLKELVIGYQSIREKRILTLPISTEMKQGTLIPLLGPNGVGKSTFLRTLAGLVAPISGSIVYDGTLMNNLSPQQRAAYMSVVFSKKEGSPSFSVRDYVLMGRYRFYSWMEGWSEKEEEDVEPILNRLDLIDLQKRNINELSDGEFQRVDLARALYQHTPMLLLDEPTSHLDYPSRNKIMSLLKDLSQERNLLIIASTHELDLAQKYGDSFLLMQKNKVLSYVEELTDQCIHQLFV